MEENELTEIIIGICIDIHKTLGAGLFEIVYEHVLCHELANAGLKFVRQKPVPVFYNGIEFDIGFFADIIVENKILLELKSIENVLPVHKKQLITYLKLTDLKVGLLINFNSNLLKDGITRLVNNF